MGIDIYARWKGQRFEDRRAQSVAWGSEEAGRRGYLHEAYHGEPYATLHLFEEAFETGRAQIPAATLRKRLPRALILVEERYRKLYGGDSQEITDVRESFRDFVALCEQKERESCRPVEIIADY